MEYHGRRCKVSKEGRVLSPNPVGSYPPHDLPYRTTARTSAAALCDPRPSHGSPHGPRVVARRLGRSRRRPVAARTRALAGSASRVAVPAGPALGVPG